MHLCINYLPIWWRRGWCMNVEGIIGIDAAHASPYQYTRTLYTGNASQVYRPLSFTAYSKWLYHKYVGPSRGQFPSLQYWDCAVGCWSVQCRPSSDISIPDAPCSWVQQAVLRVVHGGVRVTEGRPGDQGLGVVGGGAEIPSAVVMLCLPLLEERTFTQRFSVKFIISKYPSQHETT